MRSYLPLSIVLTAFLGASCATLRPKEKTFNQKQLQLQSDRIKAGLPPTDEVSTEISADPVQSSLWAKSLGSPYIIRNQKAQKVGDLLTIEVKEEATATTQAKTDAKRDGKIDLSGSLTFGQAETVQRGTLGATAANKNEFKGEGKTDRSGSFETIVQAVVENVLPNGTLFVRGTKVITINKEEQQVEISGFVRPDDIRINNTVSSRLIADAEIRYIGDGVVSDKQNTGWGTRLLDSIWPF